jgi:octaprenyl-diphosphate synthase
LNNVEASKKREIIYIIKNQNKNPKKIKIVLDAVTNAGGITYATKKMNEYRDEALSILYQFPESDIRKGLEELVRYTTDRKY